MRISDKDLEELGLGRTQTKVVEQQEDKEGHASSEYPGDTVDNSPALHGDWQCLSYSDPSELINFYDPFLNEGVVTQHPWQIEVSEELAQAKPSAAKPHRFILCAANSSGKDKYIVAPFAIWFALCKIQSRVIITSSSGNQLTAQTETYIRDLAERVNQFHGEQIFRVRQRYIRCNLTGSEIRMFATDEAGKAEGYHPFTPISEMAIIINEAKSVKEEIFQALSRCGGFNYWIEVSTPGAPVGHFHRVYTDHRLGYRTRKVTSYDCPHISQDEINRDKIEVGENSPLFRSKHLAEFTSLEGQIIITLELIERLKKTGVVRKFSDWPKRVGIDLAAGGDETVVWIMQGNTTVAKYCFCESDTTLSALLMHQFLGAQGIPKDHGYIFGDDGGVGHAILDILEHTYGYSISRQRNQSRAINNRLFGNRGAEKWFNVARLFEEGMLPVPDDDLLIRQLTSRYYKKSEGASGKLFLESKKEAKASGRPSPDRADAYILCFSDLSIEDFFNDVDKQNKPRPRALTQEELEERVMYSDMIEQQRPVRAHVFNIESKL